MFMYEFAHILGQKLKEKNQQEENKQLANRKADLLHAVWCSVHLEIGATLRCTSEWHSHAPIIWAVLSLVISLLELG